jgi:hypothetical protein
MSAVLAALLGLGSVAAAGGAFSDARPTGLVRLEPVVVVEHSAVAAKEDSTVALACTQAPNTAL